MALHKIGPGTYKWKVAQADQQVTPEGFGPITGPDGKPWYPKSSPLLEDVKNIGSMRKSQYKGKGNFSPTQPKRITVKDVVKEIPGATKQVFGTIRKTLDTTGRKYLGNKFMDDYRKDEQRKDRMLREAFPPLKFKNPFKK